MMKKLCFTILAILLFGATILSAKSDEIYKRKKVKPNFFIPEASVPEKEKLPAFPALEKGLIKVTDEGVFVKRVYVPQKAPVKKNAEKEAYTKSIVRETTSNSNDVAKYLASDGLGDDLSKDSSYIEKIKAYENDMMTFAKTRNMPRNSRLEMDLQKMSTEVHFLVE